MIAGAFSQVLLMWANEAYHTVTHLAEMLTEAL